MQHLFRRILPGCIVLFSACCQAGPRVPEGFEALLDGQVQQTDVVLLGHSLGIFPVNVRPDTVQFTTPQAVLDNAAFARLPAAVRLQALAALSQPMPRNGGRLCHDGKDKSSGCGYVATDSAAVIFDENAGQLTLFMTPQWLPDDSEQDRHWMSPTPAGNSAFIHRQTMNLSDDRDSQNLSLNGSGALGLGDRRYLGMDWAATWERMKDRRQHDAWFNNLFARQDLGNRWYLQAGRMDQFNLSGPLGGDFGFNLLPLTRFAGLRAGTTQAYVNHEVDQNATPVMVQLSRNARVDIYRGSQLLGSQYLTQGLRTLDTTSLPPGSYPLELRIFEDGVLRRREQQPFSKGGGGSTAQTQWFIQGGREGTEEGTSHRGEEAVMAAGFRTGLARNISLTSGLSLANGDWYNETRLDSQHSVLDGVLDFSGGLLTGTHGTHGDTEQLTYTDGFSASLWRSHTGGTTREDNDTENSRLAENQTAMNGSLSLHFGEWTTTMGYNNTRTAGRILHRQPSPQTGDRGQPVDFWPEAVQPASRSEAWQLEVTRSLNWHDVNINTRGGLWSSRHDGVADNGLFVGVSLSRSTPATTPHASDGYTTAGMDVRSSKQEKTQTAWNVSHTRTWQQDLYREMTVGFSGYADESWSGSVGGRLNGRVGDLRGTLSHSDQRGDEAGGRTSLTAGYGSSLAISRAGVFWGGGQYGDPAAGMVVRVEDDDERGDDKVARVRGEGQPFSLGFGQQALMLMEGYTQTEVDIGDAGAGRGGMTNVRAGGGDGHYFLPPGHLLVRDISAGITRIYRGRALDTDGRPLAGAQELNRAIPPLGVSGRFTLQSEHRETALWLLSGQRVLRCPLTVRRRRDVLQMVGDVQCEVSGVADLPQALQLTPRVMRLLGEAGLQTTLHAPQDGTAAG